MFILVILKYIREYLCVFKKKLRVPEYSNMSNFKYLVPEITENAQPYTI